MSCHFSERRDRNYGTNYIQRALVTATGLGANRPQDAVYPTSEGPAILGSYDGAKKYVMHFPKGQLPRAKGFWSLTMYDKDYFFVPNAINRQSIGPRQDRCTAEFRPCLFAMLRFAQLDLDVTEGMPKVGSQIQADRAQEACRFRPQDI